MLRKEGENIIFQKNVQLSKNIVSLIAVNN